MLAFAGNLPKKTLFVNWLPRDMSLNNLSCADPCQGAVLSTGASPNVDIQGWGNPGGTKGRGLPCHAGEGGWGWGLLRGMGG